MCNRRNLLLLLLLSTAASWTDAARGAVMFDMPSPNENVTGTLKIDHNGVVSYQVKLGSKTVIPFSRLGFELATGEYPESSLYDGWVMSGVVPYYSMPREEWRPVWGEQKVVQDHYNQMTIRATQSRPIRRQVLINLRVYDIGVAFNMEFPKQETLSEAPILADRTEFRLLGDHRAWWAPTTTDDYNFIESDLSAISSSLSGEGENDPVVRTPITLRSGDGIYINIHEAGGDVFPSMNLKYNAATTTFAAHLTPDSAGATTSGVLSGPVSTPWRSIMVTRDPAAILTSQMIYNLNGDSVISDSTWIKPVKSVGVWWEMIIGQKTWHYTDDPVEIGVTDYNEVTPNHRHGATTARLMTYIDFAFRHGFDAVSFEGWNEGWENWRESDKAVLFDFLKSYPDINEKEIVSFAAGRNVSLIRHHQVGTALTDYIPKVPEALSRTAALTQYTAVKVEYEGPDQLDNGAYRGSQSTNAHFVGLINEALRNKLAISFKYGLKPTGLSRKYPNLFSATLGRTNADFSSTGNKLKHSQATILPWNHLIGAPIEYGAGIVSLNDLPFAAQQLGSLTKQVALLLVLYSPNQFVADTPDHLIAHVPLLATLEALPRRWNRTVYLEAEIGQYVTVARQVPNKRGDWFIGGISSTRRRVVKLSLDFLDRKSPYAATIFSDSASTDATDLESYTQTTTTLYRGDSITIITADNGGFFCHLVKKFPHNSGC